MRYRIILMLFLSNCFIKGFAQKKDTLYWYDAVNKHDINGIQKIILTINDSTYKTTNYWKGKVSSIKYTRKINKCLTSIKQDTLYNTNLNEIKAIIKNEITQLSKRPNCDSILLVKKIKRYKRGKLIGELMLKRIGQFSDCPCGKWNFYENTEIVRSEEFESCYDGKLNNISLMKTVWSPNKKFKLELYKEQMIFAMPGQGSDHMATIMLKDNNNKILNYVSSNSSESIMYRDIEIEWEMDKKRVWFGKARLFDLKKKTTHNNGYN